jgi:F-type H+-transporting ATPase subunit b
MCGLGLVLCAAPALAQPLEFEGTKINVTLRPANEGAKEEIKTYDLTQKAQFDELVDLLKKGRVIELAAEEKPSKKKEEAKFKVTVVEPGEHGKHGKEGEPKTYNLADPAQYKQVLTLLRDGRVVRLAKEEPINIMAISWDLGLWTLVVFGLLFLILKRAAWGPILEGLQRREENIHGALEEAKKARDEARLLRDELQKDRDNNAATVASMLEAARRDSLKLKDELLSEGRAEVGKERERLLREISTAKDQALKDLWEQTAQLATLVSAKAIRRELTPDDHRRLVDEALTEFRGAAAELRHEAWGNKA